MMRSPLSGVIDWHSNWAYYARFHLLYMVTVLLKLGSRIKSVYAEHNAPLVKAYFLLGQHRIRALKVLECIVAACYLSTV